MPADALAELAQLDADRLRAFLRRRCAWCSTSLARHRRDAHFCCTAHRCRAWRHRRALAQHVTTDHETSPTERPQP